METIQMIPGEFMIYLKTRKRKKAVFLLWILLKSSFYGSGIHRRPVYEYLVTQMRAKRFTQIHHGNANSGKTYHLSSLYLRSRRYSNTPY
jgi:hypothetical protein